MRKDNQNNTLNQQLEAEQAQEAQREADLRNKLQQQTKRFYMGSSTGSGFFDQPNTPGSKLGN